jgi:hypothetical protein
MKFKDTIIGLLASSLVLFNPIQSFAQVYTHANGGSHWNQFGAEWHTRSNDGYCISGRGPCTSRLWYHQWTYHHNSCGPADEAGWWDMAEMKEYPGMISTWIDDRNGTMTGAEYTTYYDGGYHLNTVTNQYYYNEEWVLLGKNLSRISTVALDDNYYLPCHYFPKPMQVLYDEVKLEI